MRFMSVDAPAANTVRPVATAAFVILLLSISLSLAMASAAAQGTTAVDDCGVIDEPGSYELAEDLGANETCVEITSDDVWFTGNGSSIVGGGGVVDGAAGVYVNGSEGTLSNVSVSDLSVVDWSGNSTAGVRLENVEASRVEGVTPSSNTAGISLKDTFQSYVNDTRFDSGGNGVVIEVEGGSGNQLLDNDLHDGDDGLVVANSTGNQLRGNEALQNDGDGYRLVNASDNLLYGNAATNNIGGGFVLKPYDGDASASSDGNVVEENVADGNNDGGVVVEGSQDNQVLGNDATDNGVDVNPSSGVELMDSTNNTVEDNVVTGNELGGVLLEDSSENEVRGNDARGNTLGVGLENSSYNTVEDNVANANGLIPGADAVGVVLSDSSDYNVLVNNTADGNEAVEDPNTGDVGASVGVSVEDSSNNTLRDSSAAGNMEDGVRLDDAEDNEFSNLSVTNNSRAGVAFISSASNNTVESVDASDNAVGVAVLGFSRGNDLSSNEIRRSEQIGVALVEAQENVFEGNVVEDNPEGLMVDGSSDDNVFVDDRVSGNDEHQVEISNSTGNEFTRLNIGSSTAEDTTLSFTGENVTLDSVASSPGTPEDNVSIERYFHATENGESPYLDVGVHYEEPDVEDYVDESSLHVWSYDGGSWHRLDSTVDVGEQVVEANATSFSDFGVYGEELEPAYFDVDVVDTNSPVWEGDLLGVEVEVENTGDRGDTQEITLETPDGVEDTVVVTLDGGETNRSTLTWDTEAGDAGEDIPVEVSSDDTSESTLVEITDSGPFFVVEITDTTSPVEEGERLDVDVEISNEGNEMGTLDVELYAEGVEGARDSVTVGLGDGASTTETLSWETEGGDASPDVTMEAVSDHDTDSTNVEVQEAPYFDVEIADVDDPVLLGDEVDFEVEVENTGGLDGDQTVALDLEDTDARGDDDSVDVDLTSGEVEVVTLTADTGSLRAAGEYEATVESEDTVDTYMVEVRDSGPIFHVDVIGSNSPVVEGEALDVEVEVENAGDEVGEQTLELDVDGGLRDSETRELQEGESMELNLTWETAEGDAAEDLEALISSDDDVDDTLVSVEEPDPAYFDVEILDANSSVKAGEDVVVDVSVSNTGDLNDTQELVLEDFDGVERDWRMVSLDADEEVEVSLEWGTEEGDGGDGEVAVYSENTSDGSYVEVKERMEVEDCMEIDVSGSYELAGDLEASSTCLSVSADDVEVDGMGYSVSAEEPGSEAHAVSVGGVEDVVVANLSTEGWSDAGAGVSVEHADGVVVDGLEAVDNAFGVVLDDAANVSVSGGEFAGNVEAGVAANGTVDSEVVDSSFVDNGVRGVAFGEGSVGNVVADNTMEMEEEAVFLQAESTNNTVKGNTVHDSDVGVSMQGFSDDNDVEDNVILGSEEFGVEIEGSHGNLVAGNRVADGDIGVTIRDSEDNTLLNNSVEGNVDALVFGGATGTRLEDNVVERSDVALYLEGSPENSFQDDVYRDNDVGVSFEDLADDNVFTGVEFRGSSRVDVSVNETTGNEFRETVLASTQHEANISFSGTGYELSSTDTAPENEHYESLDGYFEVTDVDDGYVDATLHYADTDAVDVNESSVSFWRYLAGDDEWLEVEDSSVDVDRREVELNTSTVGLYGVFGDLAEPVENLDLGEEYEEISSAVDEAGDGDEIVVRSGYYTESVGVDVDNVTLRAADGSSVLVSSVSAGVRVEAQGVEVTGMQVLADPDVSVAGVDDVTVDVALENESVALEDARNVTVSSGFEDSEPADVVVDRDYGAYVDFDDGANASVDLTVTPDGGVDADAELWKHDGDGWREMDGEVEGDGVRAELSSGDFSTFAVYATSEPDEGDEEDGDDDGDDEDADDGDVDDGGGSTAGGGLSAGGGVGDDYTPPIQSRQADPAGFSPAVDAVVGEEMTFTGVVATEQVGESRDVELSVDGRVVATRSVDLGPYESERVTFTHAFEEPGEYDVRVDGEAVAYVVVTEEELVDEDDVDEEDAAEDTGEVDEASADDGEEGATDVDGEPAYAWGEGMPGFTAATAVLAVLAFSLLVRRVN